MLLDTMYHGKFLPGEMHMTYTDRHKQANEEIESICATLKQRLAKEDFALVERLNEQVLLACSTEGSESFKYGFSAGLWLMQEAKTILEQQNLL